MNSPQIRPGIMCNEQSCPPFTHGTECVATAALLIRIVSERAYNFLEPGLWYVSAKHMRSAVSERTSLIETSIR
jgi:hypothetical protein